MCCCAKARAAECLKFRDSVTTECAVCLSHCKAVGFKLVVRTVIHQKTSFQETAASFPAPTFLLSLSRISSHQLFLAVYKTLTVYLFWVLNCAKEAFFFFLFVSVLCFSTGFYPIPREKPGELLEGNFFILLFYCEKKSQWGESL